MKSELLKFGDFRAVVRYAEDVGMLRGEFVGLNGGADFYAEDMEGLRREGELSLRIFLEECEAAGIQPRAG